MNFTALLWLFALAVSLHMLEEVIWLPAWSQEAGRWHEAVSRQGFALATAVFLAFLYFLTIGAVNGQASLSVSVYLIAALAVLMILNIILPHLAATIDQRRYAPGLATGLLLNLPAGLLLLRGFFGLGAISWSYFLLTVGMMLALGVIVWPWLLRLGQRWSRSKK